MEPTRREALWAVAGTAALAAGVSQLRANRVASPADGVRWSLLMGGAFARAEHLPVTVKRDGTPVINSGYAGAWEVLDVAAEPGSNHRFMVRIRVDGIDQPLVLPLTYRCERMPQIRAVGKSLPYSWLENDVPNCDFELDHVLCIAGGRISEDYPGVGTLSPELLSQLPDPCTKRIAQFRHLAADGGNVYAATGVRLPDPGLCFKFCFDVLIGSAAGILSRLKYQVDQTALTME